MSTTIDSLQIEIQSNSLSAEQGIKGLANALGELKKNGKVTTAVNNLNNLRKALHSFANVPSSASKVLSLAQALARLKEVGSVSGIGNSVAKLATSLNSLKDVSVSKEKMDSIASALGSLSNVKAGGISTMMNGLSKIKEVTEGLNDDVIADFAKRVEILTEKLEPLSTKMTTVQAGFKGINSAAKSAGSSVKSAGESVDGAKVNFASFIYTIQEAVQWIRQAVDAFQKIIAQSIEWDGISARFGRGFGAQAQDTYDWIKKLNKEMGINIQQFMKYSSVYATMLTGFGVANEDAGKMALGYTELTYDIWAGYNDIYKTFDEASEAVKSAIAGEVEPIRRAGFTIVESQLEQTAATHGLEISLEKATEAQKSYLRYLTLVDQAHSQNLVGTYAKELNTAEGLVRTFTQQTKSLAQAFGSLFLPVLVKVMPWLQAFVDLLTDAVHWVASLFGIEIQKVDFGSSGFESMKENASGANEEIKKTEKALKDLKNATLGIDELNIISPNASNGGSGGSDSGSDTSGMDVDSLWDKSIFDSVQSQVAEIKNKIKDMLPTVSLLGTALAGLSVANLLSGIDNATSKMKGLSKGLSVASIAIAVGAIVWDLTGAYLESGSLLSWLATLGTTAIGTGLAYKFGGKGGAGFTLFVSGVAMLSRLVFELKEGTVDFGDTETWVTMLTGGIEAVIGGVFTWKVIGPAIKKAFAALSTKISAWLAAGGAAALFAKIETALASIPVWGWVAAAVVALIAGAFVAYKNWDEISKFFTDTVPEWFSGVKEAVSKWWKNIDIGGTIRKAMGDSKKWFSGVRDNVLAFWDDLIKKIDNIDWANLGYNVGKKVGTAFKNAKQWFTDVGVAFKKFWQEDIPKFFKETIPKTIEKISQDWNKFWKEKVPGFFSKLVNFFKVELPTWKNDMVKIGKDIVFGVSDGIKGSWNEFWKGVKEWINGFIKGFKDALGIKTNSTVFERFGRNIVDGLKSGMPNNSLRDKLRSIWDTAKTWWDKSKSKLATYTPSIGSVKDKLSSAWNTARNWWNNTKSTLSYTPNIGSITAKLRSAWDAAKRWWNNNVSLSIPSLSLKVTYSQATGFKKAIVNALGLEGWPKLSFAASGGIFSQGSMIWAGERGPEILANAGGGKTGVMNVQQMSEAVYEGVYSAVVAAMRATSGNGGSQAVNVYLDGKQITSAVEQRQRERGATVMGSQVFSY